MVAREHTTSLVHIVCMWNLQGNLSSVCVCVRSWDWQSGLSFEFLNWHQQFVFGTQRALWIHICMAALWNSHTLSGYGPIDLISMWVVWVDLDGWFIYLSQTGNSWILWNYTDICWYEGIFPLILYTCKSQKLLVSYTSDHLGWYICWYYLIVGIGINVTW